MPNPNAVISTVIRFQPPLDRPVADALASEGGLSVELEDGRRVRLDPTDPRSEGFAQVLDGLRRQNMPVYLEFDPESSAVTALRVPVVSPVMGIRVIDRGVLDVVLAESHARHLLRETSDDFDVLRRLLDEAVRTRTPVILAEDDAHEVIDVRLDPRPPGAVLPEIPPRPSWPKRVLYDIRDLLRRLCWWRWWPWWWWFGCISVTRAQQVFNDLANASCAPLTVPAPCIPFLYPDDGCWGRASEMCRLMNLQGLSPRKVWIQGLLTVATRNNPTCSVQWGWHVAPTLCVRGQRLFQRRRMVLDPALFAAPVTQAQWKAVQGDPMATLTDTDASVFHLFYPPHATDPTYALTNVVLATYRLALQNRAVNQGPPPYANCS
jgi:hypothetical protein